jgi:DNA-binding NarL/FixJ family response regulator
MPHLSPREHEICLMLPTGATNHQIALKLKISEGTVKEHLTRIFQKFGCHDRTVAAVQYIQGASAQKPARVNPTTKVRRRAASRKTANL